MELFLGVEGGHMNSEREMIGFGLVMAVLGFMLKRSKASVKRVRERVIGSQWRERPSAS